MSNSLVIVGTGIKLGAHITIESKAWIEQADKVFFLMNGPIVSDWMLQLRPDAESLAGYYARGKRRLDSYAEMTKQILGAVREGRSVCAVFYGHPGVFVFPAHEAIKQAREEGYKAEMLPGISAEDCLFADLGIDPAREGCQSFEATDFLIRPRRFDVHSGLVLWQVGAIGNLAATYQGDKSPGLAILVEWLINHYGSAHEVIIYEAAHYPIFEPVIQQVPLAQLVQAKVTPMSTLYVPPKSEATIDENMLARLGLTLEMLQYDHC